MDYVCVMHVRRRTGLGSVLRDYLRAERSVRFEETCIRVVLLRRINLSITLPSLHTYITYLPARAAGGASVTVRTTPCARTLFPSLLAASLTCKYYRISR